MNDNRLTDYLDPIQQAVIDALSFVEGLSRDSFNRLNASGRS